MAELKGELILRQARDLKIDNEEVFRDAGILLQSIAVEVKIVKREHEPEVTRLHKLHKQATEARSVALKPFEDARKILEPLMADWKRREEARRREEAAQAAREIQERVIEQNEVVADQLEKTGREAEAMAVRSAPLPPASVVAAPVKTDGVSFGDNWTYEIVNESLIPREYLCVDTVKLGKVVRAMKATTSIPGVRAYPSGKVRVM